MKLSFESYVDGVTLYLRVDAWPRALGARARIMNNASLESEARGAMARLAKLEPAKARNIAADYAKKPA